MLIYIFIFGVILLLSTLTVGDLNTSFIGGCIIAFMLVCLAGLRGNITADYDNYVTSFEGIKSFGQYFENPFLLEPSFYIATLFFKSLGLASPVGVFFTYSIIAVSLKMNAVFKISVIPLLSILVYFSHFYFLHEATQIRAGIAIGLFLNAIPYIGSNKKKYFLLIGIAFLFHYSSVIYLPVYFIRTRQIKLTFALLCLICPVLLFYAGLDAISLILKLPLGFISAKVQVFVDGQQAGLFGQNLHVFNVQVLLNIFLIVLLLTFQQRLLSVSSFVSVFIRLLLIGHILYFLFARVPAITWRLSEMFMAINVLAFPLLAFIFNKKWIGYFAVVCVSALMFFINTYWIHFVRPYKLGF
jgi:hypothetical protein